MPKPKFQEQINTQFVSDQKTKQTKKINVNQGCGLGKIQECLVLWTSEIKGAKHMKNSLVTKKQK